jgi:hypothetical protein
MVYRPASRCRCCKRPRDAVGGLSRSALCAHCSIHIVRDNLLGLKTRQGEYYDRWRNGVIDHAASLYPPPDILPADYGITQEEKWHQKNPLPDGHSLPAA